jgi:hypothetical protein
MPNLSCNLLSKQNIFYIVRFQVLTAVSMKMAVLWVVAPCSLVEVYLRFRGARCVHQGDRPDDEGSNHLSNLYQTTRCNNPEDSHLHIFFSFIISFDFPPP